MSSAALMVVALLFTLYGWLRFGPKRCPKCGRMTWGVPGLPIGIRRWHFHCKGCGADSQGHWRLPL
jgi:hypothetical protein